MTPITLGRQQSGHAVHRYIPSFGPYRTVSHEDDGSTGYALSDITQIIDLETGAREGTKQDLIVAVKGTAGDFVALYAIVDGSYFLQELKAATSVANEMLTFQNLAALKYVVAVTTLGGSSTILYAGGSK